MYFNRTRIISYYFKISKEAVFYWIDSYSVSSPYLYVYAVSFAVKDALVVDAEAINQEAVEFSNKLYVNVLENGKIHKRYIVSNYNTETEYLVEQGVSAGQTLAILR